MELSPHAPSRAEGTHTGVRRPTRRKSAASSVASKITFFPWLAMSSPTEWHMQIQQKRGYHSLDVRPKPSVVYDSVIFPGCGPQNQVLAPSVVEKHLNLSSFFTPVFLAASRSHSTRDSTTSLLKSQKVFSKARHL